MADVPNYVNCSIRELYDTLSNINEHKYPEAFEALDSEIRSRPLASYSELMSCWTTLKRDNWPEFTALLEDQIRTVRDKEGVSSSGVLPSEKYHTFWPRFLADLIDGALLVIVFSFITIVLVKLGQELGLANQTANDFTGPLFVIYSVCMHAMFGQTIGKMLVGVKVVTVVGEDNIGFRHAILRDIVPVASLCISGVLYFFGVLDRESTISPMLAMTLLWLGGLVLVWHIAEIVTMLLNKKRRAVHDFIAGTVVMRQ